MKFFWEIPLKYLLNIEKILLLLKNKGKSILFNLNHNLDYNDKTEVIMKALNG